MSLSLVSWKIVNLPTSNVMCINHDPMQKHSIKLQLNKLNININIMPRWHMTPSTKKAVHNSQWKCGMFDPLESHELMNTLIHKRIFMLLNLWLNPFCYWKNTLSISILCLRNGQEMQADYWTWQLQSVPTITCQSVCSRQKWCPLQVLDSPGTAHFLC